MIRRKLLIALIAAAVIAGLAAFPVSDASADQRVLLVTLVSGQQITVTMDVPPGTPLYQLRIPGVYGPIASIQDTGPAPAPGTATPTTPTTTAPATTTPAPPSTTTPATTTPSSTTPATTTPSTTTPHSSTGKPSGGDPARGPQSEGKPGRSAQRTTHATRKPRAKVDTRGGRRARATRPRSPQAVQPPSPANPTYSLADPGPAPIGVPNFFIDKFRIPPFLLPIYQAAGIEYGVRWEVLAAINEIETDYGRNLNVSTAGAVGWMQFLPSTWRQYGVDANDDGRKDPYNPVDAIFAAARYLRAAGAQTDLRKAIFAYNHAGWYVDSVVLRARLLGGLPADFVGSLTGLTEGRFPVHARATYADGITRADAGRRIARGANAAIPVAGQAGRRSIDIFARAGSPVIAVQDGEIVRMGRSRNGAYIELRDAYGNTYTYSHLKSLSHEYPVPKESLGKARRPAAPRPQPAPDPAPSRPATAGRHVRTPATSHHGAHVRANPHRAARASGDRPAAKERLFANPARPLPFRSGGRRQILDAGGSVGGLTTFKGYISGVYGLKTSQVVLRRLRPGSKVIGGTILGRIGRLGDGSSPHTTFRIRPAGRGAPLIDPKPILDGWKLLESTAIYRAEGRNALVGGGAGDPSVGQILLMSKEALTRLVLDDPHVDIYPCGRRDIEGGVIDRRVLATLAFLSASGLRPTVSALECGHSYLTTSGNVSEHSSGDAVDIAAINGIPIAGHQGPGSITDITIRRLLTLQGVMKPHQIISLMTFPGTDNTLALPDHADHIHVGFRPLAGRGAQTFDSVLKPGQWTELIQRLGTLENPTVPLRPSRYALKVPSAERARAAHQPG